MLKEHHRSFLILQRTLDVIAVSASWLLAYYVRFEILPGGAEGLLPIFLGVLPFLLLISLTFFSKNKLYISNRINSWYQEILNIVLSNFQSIIGIIITIYILYPSRQSRLMLGLYFLFVQVTMITVRIIYRNVLYSMRKKGINLRHIIVIGNGTHVEEFIEKTLELKSSGFNIIGWVDSLGKAQNYELNDLKTPLEELITAYDPDAIVIGYPNEDTQSFDNTLSILHNEVVPIIMLPNITYSLIGSEVEDFEGIPLLKVNEPHLNMLDSFLKRSLDISVTLASLVILFPFLFIVGLLVKLTSPGPVFFKQERMGRNGKIFKMLKFRSMKVGADSDGAQWTVENDPRKTKFGTFIRATSIDELPQLWNILIGQMSLVGPRPEQPSLIEKFKTEIPGYMLRHKMKAGLTGWAQVNGWRGNTSLEKRIEFDLYYIKHWSFIFDLKIILLTFVKGFINKNAY